MSSEKGMLNKSKFGTYPVRVTKDSGIAERLSPMAEQSIAFPWCSFGANVIETIDSMDAIE
jgi:hypothetical protein